MILASSPWPARTLGHAQHLPVSRALDSLRGSWDPADPWGSAVAGQFAVADALAACGVGGCVPLAWAYRPAAGGPDVLEDLRLFDLLYALDLTSEGGEVFGEPGADAIAELIHAGEVCRRLANLARLSGRDY